jgi:hypothetical protein
MKPIDRLFEYFKVKGIKPTRFEKDSGLSNGYLLVQQKRNADIGSRILSTIIDNCRDLNIEWLISGKGSMIKESKEGFDNILNEDPKQYGIELKEQLKFMRELASDLKEENKKLRNEIDNLKALSEQSKQAS